MELIIERSFLNRQKNERARFCTIIFILDNHLPLLFGLKTPNPDIGRLLAKPAVNGSREMIGGCSAFAPPL